MREREREEEEIFEGRETQNSLLSFLFGPRNDAQAAFGGGTITALVIGDRKVAPLAIFASNDVAIIWTAAWWLLNYSPLSSISLTFLEGFLPLKVACKACVNTLRAQLISSRVDFAVRAFPGVVAAPLLLGELFFFFFPLASCLLVSHEFTLSFLSPSLFLPLSLSLSLSLSLKHNRSARRRRREDGDGPSLGRRGTPSLHRR